MFVLLLLFILSICWAFLILENRKENVKLCGMKRRKMSHSLDMRPRWNKNHFNFSFFFFFFLFILLHFIIHFIYALVEVYNNNIVYVALWCYCCIQERCVLEQVNSCILECKLGYSMDFLFSMTNVFHVCKWASGVSVLCCSNICVNKRRTFIIQ